MSPLGSHGHGHAQAEVHEKARLGEGKFYDLQNGHNHGTSLRVVTLLQSLNQVWPNNTLAGVFAHLKGDRRIRCNLSPGTQTGLSATCTPQASVTTKPTSVYDARTAVTLRHATGTAAARASSAATAAAAAAEGPAWASAMPAWKSSAETRCKAGSSGSCGAPKNAPVG
mmetsp:Transcript_105744/g.303911  ORF Transcript_105744/g.303911 Transcript_105744/m.303911 type:complete len:169 (-) Transcript_105744:654-1160(-)